MHILFFCNRFTSYLFIRETVGVDFQEELSDMLLLKMLQAATRASADKDRVGAVTLQHKRAAHKHSHLLRLLSHFVLLEQEKIVLYV